MAIRKYIIHKYPSLELERRGYLLKQALKRELERGVIRQVSQEIQVHSVPPAHILLFCLCRETFPCPSRPFLLEGLTPLGSLFLSFFFPLAC